MDARALKNFIRDNCGNVAVGIAPVSDLSAEEMRTQQEVNRILSRYSPLISADSPVCQPREFFNNARSIIVLGFNFYFSRKNLPGRPPRGEIMNFYVNPGCLGYIAGQTDKVIEFLAAHGYAAMQIAAGISVKLMAARSGIGAYGKNGIIQIPGMGSWIGLNLVFTDAPLDADRPLDDPCGSCNRCLGACPTGALDTPYTCDIERCLTLHLVNNKGSIPRDIREKAGTCIAQCNICLDACPKNRDLKTQAEIENPEELVYPEIAPLVNITDAEYQQRYADTFFEFMFMDKKYIQRNAAVALGNYGDPDHVPVLAQALATQPEEIVREHAAWALGRIKSREARKALENAMRTDTSGAVRTQIALSLKDF
jgi:epoxyqueuosine reductase